MARLLATMEVPVQKPGTRLPKTKEPQMGWGSFSIGDNTYDLGHLDPFLITVAPKAGGAKAKFLVTFGSHCFTRNRNPEDAADHHFTDGADIRSFCTRRHVHSLHLPMIVRRAAGGRVFFSEGRNLLCVHWFPELDAPYTAYFNLVKSSRKGIDATMFVVSAYEKRGLPLRLPSATFATLVFEVVRGRTLKPPRDARSTKK